MACPIATGRDVYAVLVFAWPVDEEPHYLGLAIIEIACNMMAIQMARFRREQEQAEARGGDLRAERMAVVGILASGFAEDLDVRLAEIARRLGDPQRPPAEILRPARETTARFLSAIRPAAPERLELGALAADVLTLAAPHLQRRRIDVQLRRTGAHFVVGRRNDLIQLFLQLVLRMAGVLDDTDEIDSDRGALIPRVFAVEVRRQAGHEVLSLIDAGEDGTGARSSFFEIGSRAGHGFDLGVARRIVIAHEGHIEIGTSGDAGSAQCTVVLPAADADRPAPRLAVPRGARRPLSDRPRKVLLWVDEDDLFLEIMVQSLHDFDVRVARTAAEATRFLALGMVPSLVLCNVRLPDRPAHDFHAAVARQSPRVAERFVFVTDGVLTPEVASYLIASGRPTLMRPIEADQVRVLAERDSTPGQVAATATTLTDTRTRSRDVVTAPTLPRTRALVLPPTPTEGDRAALAPPAAPEPSAASLRQKKTVPDQPRVSTPAEMPLPAERSGQPDATSPSMRDQELGAIARATADTLRREGPKRGAIVLAMLRERGLSEPEALSVITYALSTGTLVREPHPSNLLRVANADPRKTVLVVDDDLDLRQTLREVLQDEGYTVDTAANGREALDVLRRSNPPRVLVLDLMMPVMDGWQLLDELKRDDSFAAIPVVVISASKTGLREAGTHEFLSKPLDYHKLVATIDRSMKLGMSAQ